MSDVKKYIHKRDKILPGFSEKVEMEYENLKLGEEVRKLRLSVGMTQEELAKKLLTTKSAVSRLENHSEGIRISTIEKVARVFNKRLSIRFQ